MALPWFVALTACVVGVASQTCNNVVTFNAGLTPHVNNYDTRKGLIGQALLDEGADFYCLQEIWFEQDEVAILAEVETEYPYHYSAIHDSVGQLRKPRGLLEKLVPKTACSVADTLKFDTVVMACGVLHSCELELQTSANAFAACLSANCAAEMKAVSEECISCLFMAGLEAMVLKCSTPDPLEPFKRFNAPGLVILSKLPITSVQYVSYFPGHRMSIQRGYLDAEIEGLGRVACTHLSAYYDEIYFEYDLSFGNYGAQQEAEIEAAHANIGSTSHIILGDLNLGPEVDDEDPEKDLVGISSANYDLFLSFGYPDPYLNQDGLCTYCASNPLMDYPNYVIDHIFIKGSQFSAASSERVLDYYTDPESERLSDHYGVEVTVCPT